MLRLTVAPAAGEEGQMPIIIHADDLEQMEKSWWLSFETLLVPHDRYAKRAAPHLALRHQP